MKTRTRPVLKVQRFHGIITVAPQMEALFTQIKRVARTDATVLVRGQTGTGKELVARSLHELSPRSNKPFKAINCATLTPELLASELFGHVRGAFTGAVRDKTGLFAAAHRGTIFLDEIAEISPEVQARLLRVLQERAFVPVGATEPTRVDVRVISATNKSLREEVEQRRFREDLMYRVRVVPLFLPRLVERDGDVEALTWHFIEHFNQQGWRRIDAIAEDAMQAMLRYPWPGTVRELRNVLEYAFAIGEGEVLCCEDLTPELRGEAPPNVPVTSVTARSMERERLVEALRQAYGRKGEAAQILGMSRSTLWRKMREHQLQ
jgi:two-component system response regulator AtoC